MKRLKSLFAKCDKDGCRRYGKRCIVCLAVLNNTPFGFLGEHLFWEKIPYLWYLPAFLGIH